MRDKCDNEAAGSYNTAYEDHIRARWAAHLWPIGDRRKLPKPTYVAWALAMKTITLPALGTMLLLTCGCSFDSSQDGLGDAATGTVFGGPLEHELFAPFQGKWHFEKRTFDPEPEHVAISGGPDISITGHIIRFGSGMLIREIRLCQARAIGDGIECEGWHHEDIHDPGDMQRVDCKLRKIGEKLELHWRILSSADFSDDPIIAAPDYVPADRSNEADIPPWWIETYSPINAK